MSRFFVGSDSDSDSSSEGEEVIQHTRPNIFWNLEARKPSVKRVVRSSKEKRYEELNNITKQIRNYKNNKDISSMLYGFENLQKAYVKASQVIAKEEHGKTPRFFIRCLVEMEDFVNDIWEDKESRSNMSKSNSKALASIRQKLRKYLKNFEDDVANLIENPDPSDSSSDNEEDDLNENLGAEKKFAKTSLLVRPSNHENNLDSETDDLDTSSDFSDDDNNLKFSNIRSFMKDKEIKREDFQKEIKDRDRNKINKGIEEGWKSVKGGVAVQNENPETSSKNVEINLEYVAKKLSEIMAVRGKRRTNRKEQITLLRELQAVSEAHQLSQGVRIKIKLAIITTIFDYNPNVSIAMKPEYWTELLEHTNEMLDVLLNNHNLIVSDSIIEENEVLDVPPYKIRGSVVTLVERLDDEFTRILKECDSHTGEYVERLKDESTVSSIIDKTIRYLERTNVPSELCRIYLKNVDHLYYKFDPKVIEQNRGNKTNDGMNSTEIMEKRCKYIYANGNTDRLKTAAILSHIYHHALHDNWFEARDLLLMSHLQQTIQYSDPSIQILYNRTMAQLGLCAFRHGNIKDAHNCLSDLMMTGRAKELLGQGIVFNRQYEKSKEQEQLEKRRQMPFHMHINLEVLECVYLVSAMLIEIPFMVAHEFEAKKPTISKAFYQQLRSLERHNLVGPPENVREHVVAAAKAMRNGNWHACNNFIINEKMNVKVWNLFNQSDSLKEMLTKIIKEESLRIYLLTYSHVYDAISVQTLAEMFQLEETVINSIISKMIINEKIGASLDDSTRTLIIHKSEPSRLQSLALQLAKKINNFVDSNERILEEKYGSSISSKIF